ncbi:MAG TPA: carboxypeptidase-like regulatory domain-containing protein [Sphingobacteriaceae bacterium]
MRLSLLISFILCSVVCFAQQPQRKIVQFSGVIYNADSNTVVPYVTITNNSNGDQVHAANYKGYFSFVAHERDTITFSAVGYKRQSLVIPANVPDNTYTIMVRLKQDVINLPLVRVYPWASTDEFKKEFMTMKFADDDLEIAKKNVSRTSIMAMAANLPRDGGEMQTYNFQNRHNSMVNKNINQKLANPLLNPFAWGSLIQQIMQGDKSRQQQ